MAKVTKEQKENSAHSVAVFLMLVTLISTVMRVISGGIKSLHPGSKITLTPPSRHQIHLKTEMSYRKIFSLKSAENGKEYSAPAGKIIFLLQKECIWFSFNSFERDKVHAFKVARNSFQHLNFDGSL